MAAAKSRPADHRGLFSAGSIALFSSTFLGSFVLALFAWIAIPTLLLGWDPLAITSESMAPAIRTGDVILVQPDTGPPNEDSIVAFDDGESTVVHRVVAVNPDGTFTTRGDANPAEDSTPVAQGRLLGRGRLLVPYLGYLRVIDWTPLLAIGGLASVAVWWWPKRRIVAISMLVVALGLGLISLAVSSFVTATGNDLNTISALEVAPPTNVTAECGLVGAGDIDVDISWTPSPTSGLTSYRVFHDGPSAGTDFTEVGNTGPEETAFTHQIPTTLASVGTHTYMVRSVAGPWESVNSNTDAVGVTQAAGIYSCAES